MKDEKNLQASKLRKLYINSFISSDFKQTELFPENQIKTAKYTW
jgi:NADPH-dependent 7-cyano-7-deazaguanine reductase QueF-like protein